jgi:myosin-3
MNYGLMSTKANSRISVLVSGGKRVAIKIQAMTPATEEDVRSEYHILRKLSSHPNLPDLYGVYLKKSSSPSQHDKLWFVMEVWVHFKKFCI